MNTLSVAIGALFGGGDGQSALENSDNIRMNQTIARENARQAAEIARDAAGY
jgi:hypothetical protein